ncbi:Metallo-dependent phosphatase-like protein [Geopyxis carbonaria]|nr:Metallo-dependent phosphatase-like protein [Geopyxis carbonaria]
MSHQQHPRRPSPGSDHTADAPARSITITISPVPPVPSLPTPFHGLADAKTHPPSPAPSHSHSSSRRLHRRTLLPLSHAVHKDMRPRARLLRLALYAILLVAFTAAFWSRAWDRYYAYMTTPGVNEVASGRLACTQVRALPVDVVPTEARGGPERRLVFVGDVHGMYSELMELLETIQYTDATDHLVFTGDLVAKGPDSLQVVEFARTAGASCVRGNQDDRILLHYHSSSSSSTPPTTKPAHAPPTSSKLDAEKAIAAAMTPDQAAWLDACPLILTASNVRGMGEVAVVHAGLVHGVPLEQQDPSAVMNMRSINTRFKVPSRKPEGGMHWAEYWNREEMGREKPVTVVYGHYAAAGLDLRPLTVGLDSNCVRGGSLSALIVSSKTEKPKVVQLPCRKAV